jgi:hypothetical protein
VNERSRFEILMNAFRAMHDQLQSAIEDRESARLMLATIATSRRLDADELRRFARRACPCDPWDLRIDLEKRCTVSRRGMDV